MTMKKVETHVAEQSQEARRSLSEQSRQHENSSSDLSASVEQLVPESLSLFDRLEVVCCIYRE